MNANMSTLAMQPQTGIGWGGVQMFCHRPSRLPAQQCGFLGVCGQLAVHIANADRIYTVPLVGGTARLAMEHVPQMAATLCTSDLHCTKRICRHLHCTCVIRELPHQHKTNLSHTCQRRASHSHCCISRRRSTEGPCSRDKQNIHGLGRSCHICRSQHSQSLSFAKQSILVETTVV